jgi:hypothetical protein
MLLLNYFAFNFASKLLLLIRLHSLNFARVSPQVSKSNNDIYRMLVSFFVDTKNYVSIELLDAVLGCTSGSSKCVKLSLLSKEISEMKQQVVADTQRLVISPSQNRLLNWKSIFYGYPLVQKQTEDKKCKNITSGGAFFFNMLFDRRDENDFHDIYRMGDHINVLESIKFSGSEIFFNFSGVFQECVDSWTENFPKVLKHFNHFVDEIKSIPNCDKIEPGFLYESEMNEDDLPDDLNIILNAFSQELSRIAVCVSNKHSTFSRLITFNKRLNNNISFRKQPLKMRQKMRQRRRT